MGYEINYRKSAGRFGETEIDERDDTIFLLHHRQGRRRGDGVGGSPRSSSVTTATTAGSSFEDDDESTDPSTTTTSTNPALSPPRRFDYGVVGEGRTSSSSSSTFTVESRVSDSTRSPVSPTRELCDRDTPPSSMTKKNLFHGEEEVNDNHAIDEGSPSTLVVNQRVDTDDTVRWGRRSLVMDQTSTSPLFQPPPSSSLSSSPLSPTTEATRDKNRNQPTGSNSLEEEESAAAAEAFQEGNMNDGDRDSCGALLLTTTGRSLDDEGEEWTSLVGDDGWSSNCYDSEYEFSSENDYDIEVVEEEEEEHTSNPAVLWWDAKPMEFHTIPQERVPAEPTESWKSGSASCEQVALLLEDDDEEESSVRSHENKSLEALMALTPTTKRGLVAPPPEPVSGTRRNDRGSLRLLRHVRNSVGGIRGRRAAKG